MPMNLPIVTIDHVGFAYNKEPILEDITFVINKGDFLGLIGPNGSGKTTLLKIILGLLRPSTGTVRIQGTKIGYVPQKAGSTASRFPISVEEVVGMGGATSQTITQSLQEVGLQDNSNSLLNELSGGQQQRVFIARALASNPDLLVLDEPTVGVDSESQAKFYKLLKDLNKNRHLTLILVSHDFDVVAHEANLLASINHKLLYFGLPKDFLVAHGHQYV